MIFPEPSKWLPIARDLVLTIISSSGLIIAVGYLMRDAITKLFTKGIEHRFEKKMEAFKSSVRDNEKELEQIRSFLISARKDRNAAIQLKKFEAAEAMMRAVHSISKLRLAAEYLTFLNIEEIMKFGDDSRIINLINTLSETINIDEKMISINSIDTTLSRLYLTNKTLKIFDVYSAILLGAAMMMKALAIPSRDKSNFFKKDGLSKIITELIPSSKEYFDKQGDSYSYFFATYFHNEILQALRNEVSSIDELSHDTDFAASLAFASRQAQANVLASLQKLSLPESLIKPQTESLSLEIASSNQKKT
jgi:hypothetical protein